SSNSCIARGINVQRAGALEWQSHGPPNLEIPLMATQPPQPHGPPPPPGAFDVPVPVDSPTSFSAMPQTMVTTAEMETARRDGSGAPRWFVRLGIVAAVSISLVA